MKYGDRGAAVTHVQGLLIEAGYELPRFGADGDLGSETWSALYQFACDGDGPWSLWSPVDFEAESGDVPSTVLAALVSETTADAAERGSQFFDITDEHSLKKGRAGLRDPSRITTVVMHQTAVMFGTTKRNRAKYGPQEALHRRFYNVACHTAALQNGDVLYVNKLRAYVWHGNVANRFSVGLEIEGHS